MTLNDKAIDFDKIREISRTRSEITITFDDKSTIECHEDHFSGSITLESPSLKEPLIVEVEEIQYFTKNS